MKERIVISIMCCVLICLGLFNAQAGPTGRKQETINTSRSNTTVAEERFKVSKDENGRLTFVSVLEKDLLEETNNMKLHAMSACMIDAKTGRVLFGKNHMEPRAMASTTKILTCLVALENCSLDETVTASEYAASMPDVQLNMSAGEQFRLYDLLLSLMLESHNDTAVAIAEHVGGSVDAFCKMMTERAGKIGCNTSVFLTPNGLDKEIETETGLIKHSTTATELALIMRECLKNEQFVSICRTQNAMISNLAKSKSYQLSNHNALLDIMQGALVGKTGFTCDAGYCYVGAVERGNNVYICSLLGCGWPNNKNYKWQDMKTLIDFADEAYECLSLDDIPLNNQLYDEIFVTDALVEGEPNGFVPLEVNMSAETDSSVLVMREGEVVSVLYEFPKSLCAPVESGDIVGNIYYTINGQTFKKENLTVKNTIHKLTLKDMLYLVLNKFCYRDSTSSDSSASSEKCES